MGIELTQLEFYDTGISADKIWYMDTTENYCLIFPVWNILLIKVYFFIILVCSAVLFHRNDVQLLKISDMGQTILGFIYLHNSERRFSVKT